MEGGDAQRELGRGARVEEERVAKESKNCGGAECETEETCDPPSCPNLRISGRHVAGKGGNLA